MQKCASQKPSQNISEFCGRSHFWWKQMWHTWALKTQFTYVLQKNISLFDRGKRCITRHNPASDRVVCVCVYVQVARLPLLPWQVPLGTLVFLYLDCSSYIPLASIKSHIYVCVCLRIRGKAWWERAGNERAAGAQLSPSFLSQQYRIKSLTFEECSIFKSSYWLESSFGDTSCYASLLLHASDLNNLLKSCESQTISASFLSLWFPGLTQNNFWHWCKQKLTQITVTSDHNSWQ